MLRPVCFVSPFLAPFPRRTLVPRATAKSRATNWRTSPPMMVTGISAAGVETCLDVPSLKLLLDLGCCPRAAVHRPIALISHGHLDHIGAIAQHAARRTLMGLEPGTYVVPRAIAAGVEGLFNAAGSLDGQAIARRVVPLEPGETFDLGKRRFLRAFPTFHPVQSQGYTVFEQRKSLRPLYQHLSGAELGELRRRGVAIEDVFEVPILSFTGDTRIEALEVNEELSRTETLVIETTYLDGLVPVEQARQVGHIHLDELAARLPLLPQQSLAFYHFSTRYAADQIRRILHERLPEDLLARTQLIGIDPVSRAAPHPAEGARR